MVADVTTQYLGLELRSPIVAGPSPLTGSLGTLIELERAGAGAVVLPSLFEEEIAQTAGPGAPVEPSSRLERRPLTPGAYAELIHAAKTALSIPVVASLNGTTPGGWAGHASFLQDAGADALELNVYAVETDPYTSAAAVEERMLRLVHEVRGAVSIPVAVKLTPYYTSLAHVAERLAQARVDGLVLFNRFVQPDVDVERVQLERRLELSTSYELRLPLRWTALLHGRFPLSLAATSGVSSPEDVVKLLLVGADVVMVASELVRRGPAVLLELTDGLRAWLAAHGNHDLRVVRGLLSEVASGDRGAFERVEYVGTLTGYATTDGGA